MRSCVADGEIISSSRPQIIQNLEGGILSELLVQEGDVVARGAVLARLHGTQFKSSVEDLRDQITAHDIRRLRLEAETRRQFDFDIPAKLAARSPEMAASEKVLLKARQEDFVKRSQGARKVAGAGRRERPPARRPACQEIVALIEVTRARKEHADAEKRYDEIVTQTELERAQEYSDTLKELATLRQNLSASLRPARAHRPDQPDARHREPTSTSPPSGGVVRPGEQIMEIIPLDEELLVEARVAPQNIANIRPGQAATIKLSAYDTPFTAPSRARSM